MKKIFKQIKLARELVGQARLQLAQQQKEPLIEGSPITSWLEHLDKIIQSFLSDSKGTYWQQKKNLQQVIDAVNKRKKILTKHPDYNSFKSSYYTTTPAERSKALQMAQQAIRGGVKQIPINKRYKLKGVAGDVAVLIDQQSNKTINTKLNQPLKQFPKFKLIMHNNQYVLTDGNKIFPLEQARGESARPDQQTSEKTNKEAPKQNQQKHKQPITKQEVKLMQSATKMMQDFDSNLFIVREQDGLDVIDQKEDKLEEIVNNTEQIRTIFETRIIPDDISRSISIQPTQFTAFEKEVKKAREEVKEQKEALLSRWATINSPEELLANQYENIQQWISEDQQLADLQILERIQAMSNQIDQSNIPEDQLGPLKNQLYWLGNSFVATDETQTKRPNAEKVKEHLDYFETQLTKLLNQEPLTQEEFAAHEKWVNEKIQSGDYSLRNRSSIMMLLNRYNNNYPDTKNAKIKGLVEKLETMKHRVSNGRNPKSGAFGAPPFSLTPPFRGQPVNPLKMRQQ